MRKRLDLFAAILIGAVFLSLMPWSRMTSAKNDFVHFYIGGMLYGHPEIFSPEVNYSKQRELIGATLPHSFFGRPAFYGLFLKPLTLLPYKQAYWLFQCGGLLSLAVFLKLNSRRYPSLLLLCIMSPALFANFVNGQDVMYLLLFCSLSLLAAERGWDFLAGLVLSLCAIKAHLFLPIPLAVILWKRWRILAGGAAGVTILLLLSLPGAGLSTQLELMRQLGNPEHSPYPDLMPSLRSLTGDHHQLFWAASIAVLFAVVLLMHRSQSYQAAFGWALIGGLLASYHAYVQDCLLLLLALALIHDELSKTASVLLQIAVLPFIYIALAAGYPYSAIFPAVLLACLFSQLLHTYRPRATVPALAQA
jgi:hypothetical protein